MASSSQRDKTLILAAPHGRPITAYNALTATSRYSRRLDPPALVVVSGVLPQAAGPEALRGALGGALGHPPPVGRCVRVRARASPPVPVRRRLPPLLRSFRAHGCGAVSCLALNDDGSLLVSGGDDGWVAVFALIRVLGVEDPTGASAADDHATCYRVAAHVAPLTDAACRHGRTAGATRARSGGWRTSPPLPLRTLALPCTCTALSLANAAGLVAVAVPNWGRNLLSCSEDGEARVPCGT
ncbi:hypothetical protein BS78_02G215900 [Paspalum vaginatum]|nr:hypothetical protein BS78_02G215900 [Paspalum vaginatum]